MEKIWEFFENINEYVYVADMDTYELVYMNKKTLATYGYTSLEQIVGKKCYEVLQGCSEACTICNNTKLMPKQFREWEYYNPYLKKSFAIKDSMIQEGEKRYRIELAIESGITGVQGGHVQDYLELEMFVNEGMRLALRAATPDQSLDVILEYLGRALNGERTYIFERNASGGDDNSYEWVAMGVKPQKEILQNLPAEVCANWYQSFRENRNIIIEELEDIREKDPLQYENLKRQDIYSLVVVPLYDDGVVIGFYGVDNPPGKSLNYASNMLQIMGHFIVSSLKRRNLMRQLEKMSYSDQLTGLGNRYAVERFVRNMDKNASIGAIYCDITGLKRVNDQEGHEAGDQLILRARNLLVQFWKDYEIFRIGGDEMLVLASGIEETVFQAQVVQMRAHMQEYRVAVAIGTVWKSVGTDSIDQILTESERLMYEDKAVYYKQTGLNRRR